MHHVKDGIINEIRSAAREKRGRITSEFVRAPSGSKEPILAEMEYQAWLEESCEDCLYSPNDLLL